MSENGEIYTAGKNFTLPPALTNSTSGLRACPIQWCPPWWWWWCWWIDDIGLDVHFTKQTTGRCVKGVEKILDRFEDLPPIIILVIICRVPSAAFVASVLECYRNVVTIELWGGIKADATLLSGHFKSFQRCSWGRLWKWKTNKFSQYFDRPHIYEKESPSLMAKWLGIKFQWSFVRLLTAIQVLANYEKILSFQTALESI